MGKVARNAFDGYSYQYKIALLFFLIFDSNKAAQEFIIEIDNDKTIDNFDDIKMTFSDNSYFIQAKNYRSQDFTIGNSKINYSNNTTLFDDNGIKIFVTEENVIEANTNIFNMPAYKHNNVYVVNIPIDDRYVDFIEKNFNSTSRINQLISYFDLKILHDKAYSIKKNEVPPFMFYSSKLLEDTIKIRKTKFDKKDFCIIYGRPGIGKSHFINELNIDDSSLYRFWISEEDDDRTNRLLYSNFISQMECKLFSDNIKHSEDEIIKQLVSIRDTFFIDGLDHVQNYNLGEFKLYVNFINKMIQNNCNVVILTRPLIDDPFDCNKMELTEWTSDETIEFCEANGLNDYIISQKIYEISNGYPIIVSFLLKHYLEFNVIPVDSKTDDILKYYEKLFTYSSDIDILSLFRICKKFITFNEYSVIQNDGICVNSCIKRFPYLLSIRGNRIYLIHDSLHLFLKERGGSKSQRLENEFSGFIKKSLESRSVEFFSRLDYIDLKEDESLVDILLSFIDFKEFVDLCINNIDYDSIRDLYLYIYRNLSIFESITGKQLYTLLLIVMLVKRNNIYQNHGLIYQLFKYCEINSINWEDMIYSNHSLYHLFYYFKYNDLSLYEKELSSDNYSVEHVVNNLIEELNDEINFFNKYSHDKFNETLEKFSAEVHYVSYELFADLVIYASLYNHSNYSLNLIGKCAFEDNFNVYCILCSSIQYKLFKAPHALDTCRLAFGKIKDNLSQLGFKYNESNYTKLNFNDFIYQNRMEHSCNLANMITGYIRLKNLYKEKFDIELINLFNVSYHFRKDYSVYQLYQLMYEFKECGFINNNYALETLSSFKDKSEKGIRDLTANYINLLSSKEIFDLDQNQFFSNINLDYSCLSIEVLNSFSFDTIWGEIYSYVKDGRYNVISNSFPNIINSIHGDKIIARLKSFGIVLEKVTLEKEKTKDSNVSCESHIIDIYNHDLILEKIKDPYELSKLYGTQNQLYPFCDLFEKVDQETMKKDIVKILTYGFCNNYVISRLGINGNLIDALYTIPMILLKYNKLTMNEVFELTNEYIEISLLNNSITKQNRN